MASELRDEIAAVLPTLRGNHLCHHGEDAGCEDLGPEHHWEFRHADAIMAKIGPRIARLTEAAPNGESTP